MSQKLYVINKDDPTHASGYFDVPLVNELGQFIYNEKNEILAKRFIVGDKTTVIASDTKLGNVRVGKNLSIDENGVLNAHDDYILPTASDTVSGGVKIGENLVMSEDGTLRATWPELATTLEDGLMSAADKLKLDAVKLKDYVISYNQFIEEGTPIGSLTIDGKDTVLYVPIANKEDVGSVIVGNNIDVTDGVISVKTSSNENLGLVKIGDNIDIDNGTISVKTGSLSDKGIVQIGNNIDVTDGTISVKTSSSENLGLVKIGTNIDVTDGTISVKTGSLSDKGIVQIGNNIDVDNGTISVKTGSLSDKGIVQIGNNIDVDNGTISVKTSSNENLGLVKVGNNIDVDNGTISVKTSSTTDKGIVQLSSSVNGTSETLAGTEKAVGIAGTTVTTTNNNESKAYIVGSSNSETTERDTLLKDDEIYVSEVPGRLHVKTVEYNQQYGTTITLENANVDLSLGTCFTINITQNCAFTFTNANKCTCFNLLIENGGNFTITWPDNIKWTDGETPELSTTGLDCLVFMTPDGGTKWYGFSSFQGI